MWCLARYESFFNFVARPVATHSATKMFPSCLPCPPNDDSYLLPLS